jgi:hypothetical protein
LRLNEVSLVVMASTICSCSRIAFKLFQPLDEQFIRRQAVPWRMGSRRDSQILLVLRDDDAAEIVNDHANALNAAGLSFMAWSGPSSEATLGPIRSGAKPRRPDWWRPPREHSQTTLDASSCTSATRCGPGAGSPSVTSHSVG